MKRIQLSQLSDALKSATEEYVDNVLLDMRETAVNAAPEDTGRLIANIAISVNGSNDNTVDSTTPQTDKPNYKLGDDIALLSMAEYSLFVEEGDQDRVAQPYMTTTADSIEAISRRAASKVK